MKKKLSDIRGKAFCLTINTPDEKIDAQIEAFIKNKELFQFLVYQKEKGKKRGTEHYQMYLEVKSTIRASQIKKLFPTAHIEKRQGSQNQAAAYCQKKDGTEIGTPLIYGDMAKQGRRQDLVDLMLALENHDTWMEVIRDKTIHCQLSQFMPLAKEYFNSKKSNRKPLKELHPWQQQLVDIISEDPEDRKIIWYVDAIGGKGKTTMMKQLVSQHDAQIMGGRGATDLYQYAKTQSRIAVWDFSRGWNNDKVPYSEIEKIKDGTFTSTFRNPMSCSRDYEAHIIVFSNFPPDLTKMSDDRWNIITLHDDDCDPFLKY